ncbi:MAG TPA: type 2 lanthipeptide synthetase LanM family protein [Xanthobacteraceae bacterium]|nr:type 2 lanthipeptide synthetase LanM family protein [Xanthobacteraceae bacterium]
MDAFYQRLRIRAATIDELLSDAFEASPVAMANTDLAAKRVAAWRRSCAAGDQALFGRRLARDGLSPIGIERVFAGAERSACAPDPRWIEDAVWLEAALRAGARTQASPVYPFEDAFVAQIERAEALVWSGLDAGTRALFDESARASLRTTLLSALSELCAPALYERFAKMRGASAASSGAGMAGQAPGDSRYREFVADLAGSGFRKLFDDKPVLLRLIAGLTRQWIDATEEFVLRLAADLPAIRGDLIQTSVAAKIVEITSGVSDPHNEGRSVLIVRFTDNARVVYKPKDLRVDLAWRDLVEGLNGAEAPIALKTARTLSRDGYGWTEFIEHTGCNDMQGCGTFFWRAGAWLALLHCFAATDIHQENMIAAGDHPVLIDLETILQPSPEEHKIGEPEAAAFDAAMEIIGNSVMTVGLLPAYGRSVDNNVFAMGGMTADWGARTVIAWNDLNTDAMRPAKMEEAGAGTPNLPHVNGRYAKLGDHIDSFVAGFADYADFLMRQARDGNTSAMLNDFGGLAVRKVVRPTRFYYMLLRRLKDHRSMTDGVIWSAQSDFMARLADWDKATDPLWPLQRAERAALVSLNVPYFITPSDGTVIYDQVGHSAETAATPGLDRARARLQALDENEIAWQVEVIRENVNQQLRASNNRERNASVETALAGAPDRALFEAEAERIAAELARHAIRRGPGAAWIGLDWLGDSEVFQLVCLGPDLYNGATGIALFLAAHAAVSGHAASAELALAGLAHVRRNLKSRSAARFARSLGIGAATGLGSIVYGFAVIAKSTGDATLLQDAQAAVRLFTDELITADKQLDVMGGAAGAVLALLRLHRDTQLDDALTRAIRCGEHLLASDRVGDGRQRSWIGQGFGGAGLNGMSHGAAGFAYALAALAAASGRADFADAAAECIAFEDASYDSARRNWPDLRVPGQPAWPCQWCHGAPGIGLARLATMRRIGANAAVNAKLGAKLGAKRLDEDIGGAIEAVKQAWPGQLDTLCCGTLGGIEFLCEVAERTGGREIGELAARRLTAVLNSAAAAGDYRWNSGKRQFNLGLFRGLAGVGYTLLRRLDHSLPNVLIWE